MFFKKLTVLLTFPTRPLWFWLGQVGFINRVRTRGARTLFFFFFFSLPSSQLNASPKDFYALIPEDESLHSHPQFVLVEDFSADTIESEKLKPWQWNRQKAKAFAVSLDDADGRSKSRGRSLKLKLRLSKKQSVSFARKLEALDVSQAEILLFKIKTDIPHLSKDARFYLTAKDQKGQRIEIELNDQISDKVDSWSQFQVPLAKLNPLDLDQLDLLEFNLKAKKSFQGNFWMDELSFYGEGNVNFKSSADNIIGFPKTEWDTAKRKSLEQEQDTIKLLRRIGEDTWRYFQNSRDKKTALIVDNIKMGDLSLVSGYTSPTNIAMDLLSTLAAMDLAYIEEPEALRRIQAVLSTLFQMKKYKGFFFNFYETKNLQITRHYISSVDNGWLAVSLVVVRQAFPSLHEQASQILDGFNFEEFLDPETNQLVIGFDVPVKDFGKHHYGMLVSEARATSLYAIGKGDLPPSHWWFLYRTPPEAWRWQPQVSKGQYVTRDGIEYFQGYYEKDGVRFVPSWGGSMFEFLMPTLVVDEKKLAPNGLGKNDRIATQLQIDYALKEKEYPLWGISPAAIENGKSWRYREFGVKTLGVKPYPDQGFITPHASFLALDSLPEEAIKNIRKLLSYELYGEYGFYDSMHIKTFKCQTQYLALDQGMTLVAIDNYLSGGKIKARFHADSIGKNIESLLMKESFFND